MRGFWDRGVLSVVVIARLQGIVVIRDPCSGRGVGLVIHGSIPYSIRRSRGLTLCGFAITTRAGLFVGIVLVVSNPRFSFQTELMLTCNFFTEGGQASLSRGFS